MAVSKVILNGNTLMDVTQDTVAADKLLQTYTATKNDGTKVTGTYVPQTCVLQSKTVSPSTSQQTVSPDSGYDGLSSVKVNAMPSGSAATPATTITANPSISVSSGGLITASVSASQSVTPTVSAGYVSSGTAGTVSVSGSNTSQLTTKAAQTYTPTTTDQTIASGQYLTGAQTVKGDANLLAENIKKDVVLFGVTGTLESGGGSSKSVTIYLTNSSSPSSFISFDIYETTNGVVGNKIGAILSPEGSTTVTVPAASTGIKCVLTGGYVEMNLSMICFPSGDVGFIDYTTGIPGTIYYAVSGDGNIYVDGIDWDD